MVKKIQILHLEDSLKDSELIHSLIKKEGIEHDYFLTDNEKDYLTILEKENIDLILSDFNLLDYNGNEAFKVAREKYSSIPFIFVSGVMGEDAAINAMLKGATDYVLKNKLERLVPAIKRAIYEHEIEIKHKKVRINIIEKNKEIEAQKEKYFQLNNELIYQNKEKEEKAAKLILANEELAIQNREKEKRADELILANKELAFQNKEKEKRANELITANKELAIQNKEKEKRAAELIIANKELAIQNKEKEKRAAELIIANKELVIQNREKEKRADELIIANKELAFQNVEKEKRAAELIIANKELAFQNEEKEKRAEELIIANKELAFQNEEKEKKAAKLIIANKELAIQNREKEKRADELLIASKELDYQNKEKAKRAAELSIANTELAYQNAEKGKRAAELIIANKELAFQNEEKEEKAEKLIIANKELAFQNVEKEKRAVELIVTNKELHNQILERKQVELDLRETNEYLENLFNYANAPIIVWDVQFNITRFNPAFEVLTGRKTDDVIGKSVSILFSTDSAESSMKLIRKAQKGERLNIVEIKILHKDGSEKTLLWNSASVIGADGKTTIATIAQGHDITLRKQAEEGLRESMSKFKTLVEAIPQKVFMKDLNFKWVFINELLARDFNIKPEDVVGKADIDLFPKELADKYHDDDIRIIETGQTEELEEKYLQEGREAWVNTVKTPIRDESGNVIGVLGLFWDITERKQIEEQLNRTMQNLERSNKELEQFAYVASHDLQEPLRMVSSYTQLLERRYKDKLDQDANEFIQFAVDGASRMQKLINDLLDYSRITSRGKEFTKVDLSHILGQVISNLQLLIIENSALITNDDLPEIKADESQILRVFQNLIQNALKFKNKSEHPKIHISYKKKNDFYEFAIRDNGIGMDMQYHDRVFTIFQRLHTKEEYPGTGIGLSICKRIIERHGGRIWFESKENEGTTFYFTLCSL